jgi:hypothetical protein
VAGPGFEGTIETPRGRISEERAEQLLRFIEAIDGAPEGEAAREWLPKVVCVLLDEDGEIAGISTVEAADVPLIGDRRFWVYRGFLRGDAAPAEPEMISAAFAALQEEFDPAGAGPIGICLVADPTAAERRPEAVWPDTELLLAGHLDDGRQVRIRYFWGAAIGPDLPNSPTLDETLELDTRLDDRYRIERFEESGVTPDDVLALWAREGVVPAAEAQRRVHEVHLVATERGEGVVGASSAYLQRNPQLRMDLWYYRAFVAEAHRMSNLAVVLAVKGRDLLEERFVTGEDRRGAGVAYEVENEGLKRYFNKALWMPTDFTFIGENERGSHVRVHYFPGAPAPAPGGGPTSSSSS